jgi:hypothetical protein
MSHFQCTSGGRVALGRRRLRLILLGPALLMLGLAVFSWLRGAIFQGLLCVAVFLVLIVAWRMANQLEPLYFEVQGKRLEIRLRWRLFHVDLDGARARLVTDAERRHLEQLVSAGGIVATSGSYDSHRLGEFDLYASDLDNAILLETEETRLILTPDDPRGLVDAVGRIHPS